MTTRGLANGQRLGLGAFLLLAAWLCAPTAAWASCGDYVTVGNHSLPHMVSEQHTAAAPASPAAPGPLPTERPCTGLLCRRNQGSLPPAPLPPSTPTSDQWAAVIASLAVADAGSFTGMGEPGCPRPIQRSTSLFRPPRTLA